MSKALGKCWDSVFAAMLSESVVVSLVEVEADMISGMGQASVMEDQACLFPMINLHLDCLISEKVGERMGVYALVVAD